MPTWMVVEDEPDIYELLLAMFEIWGIHGVAFVDGPEAVAWVEDVDRGRVRAELPEVALLDIRLPQLSGPEVAQRLRRSPRLGQIGIVLITAYRLPPDDEKLVMAQAQADLLLFKPLPTLNEMREMIERVIARRATARASMLAAAGPAQAPPAQTLPSPAPPASPADRVSRRPSLPGARREDGPPAPPAPPTGSDHAEH